MAGAGSRASNDFLLDTGIIIRYLRKIRQAADLLDYLEEIGQISVSAITYMEILVGSQPNEEEATMLFFDRVSPVTVGQEIAYKAASLVRNYPPAFGTDNPRGFPDAIIAATAWERGSALVTLNTRHFARVPIAEVVIQAIDQNSPDWVAAVRS